MTSHWTYNSGMLVARNDTGKLLAAWEADASMGQPLADLFNRAQDLSALLLQPFSVPGGSSHVMAGGRATHQTQQALCSVTQHFQ